MKRTMEYPFKDLLPIDEVLEREGYYNDWTHLDPEVFYSLTQISEYIKTKGYGVDVRLLISQLAEHFGLRVTQITDAMNEFNDLKPKAELSISKSAEALTKSQNALNVANGIDAKATNALNLSESADTLSKSVQEQFNQVVIDGDSSVEAAQARVGADGEVNATLKARLDKEHNEVTAQLAQMSRIKIFDRIPTEADLSEGEFGAVIASLWPWVYDFGGINGQSWDPLKFDTKKYEATAGLMDKVNSFARLQDGTGVIKVKKTASAGLAIVEQKITTDLNFTNGRKYGIKFDVKRSIVDGVNRGNCGFSISSLQNPTTYYPFNYTLTDGISLVFGGGYSSGKNDVSVNYRSITGGVMNSRNLATGGGLTTNASLYLYSPQGEWLNFEVIISTNSIQIIINGTEYLNIEEDLSALNASNCKFVIWGMNNDADSLEVNHYFDNLIIDEVV